MSSPTAETDTSRPPAIWGSIPITTNSVVPMPKAPMARASRARGTSGLRSWGAARAGRRHRLRLEPTAYAPCSSDHGRMRSVTSSHAPPVARRVDRWATVAGGGGGSGLEQHLDRAVLLLPEGL